MFNKTQFILTLVENRVETAMVKIVLHKLPTPYKVKTELKLSILYPGFLILAVVEVVLYYTHRELLAPWHQAVISLSGENYLGF